MRFFQILLFSNFIPKRLGLSHKIQLRKIKFSAYVLVEILEFLGKGPKMYSATPVPIPDLQKEVAKYPKNV